jgi:hypothetical protein
MRRPACGNNGLRAGLTIRLRVWRVLAGICSAFDQNASNYLSLRLRQLQCRRCVRGCKRRFRGTMTADDVPDDPGGGAQGDVEFAGDALRERRYFALGVVVLTEQIADALGYLVDGGAKAGH